MLTALLITVALTLLTALYVAAEFGAVSVRRSRLRQLAAEGHRLARRLVPIVADPRSLDRYIAACQVGITIGSLVLGAYAQATFAPRLTPLFESLGGLQQVAAQSTAAIVVLVLLTGVNVIMGELVPKSIALQFPTQVALYTLPAMLGSLWLFGPFIKVLNGSGLALLKLLGAPPHGHRHIHSPEEIELLIAESRDGGLLEPDEHRRLERALRLNLRPARQLMVPRPRLSAIDLDTPIEQVLRMVAQSPYSRLPVFKGSIDNVVGVLHTKDLVLRYAAEGLPLSLESIIRPVTSVHESVTADRLLRELRERRTHHALVVDEFGGTAGLVTLEDVIAELLGAVGDEFKTGAVIPERLPDGGLRLPGAMRADDAASLLGEEWESDATTLGGHVVTALGHVPVAGEHVQIGRFDFAVERVAHHAIEMLVARAVEAPAAATDGED